MRISVPGGDGYCGWATALYLSRQGHQVSIVQQLQPAAMDFELGVQTLTPIRSLTERVRAWKECVDAPASRAEEGAMSRR